MSLAHGKTLGIAFRDRNTGRPQRRLMPGVDPLEFDSALIKGGRPDLVSSATQQGTSVLELLGRPRRKRSPVGPGERLGRAGRGGTLLGRL